jgi:hypothetical protein
MATPTPAPRLRPSGIAAPAADQNADRCPDTGADADTHARVLDFLSTASRVFTHRDLLSSSIGSVVRLAVIA